MIKHKSYSFKKQLIKLIEKFFTKNKKKCCSNDYHIHVYKFLAIDICEISLVK